MPVFIFAQEVVTKRLDLVMKAVTKDTGIHFCTGSGNKDIGFSHESCNKRYFY
jgi:hypothetical protein